MKVALPAAPVVLDVVSEGGALHEGVVAVLVREGGVCLVQVGEQVQGVLKGAGVVLEQPILGDVGDCRFVSFGVFLFLP